MRNELITFTNPKSPVSEMFKTLRTNLQFMSNSKKLQTILVTSTLPGEGKS
jgi:Mrp family chromosome partitioning ATPase